MVKKNYLKPITFKTLSSSQKALKPLKEKVLKIKKKFMKK
jgi:hypothetical protein